MTELPEHRLDTRADADNPVLSAAQWAPMINDPLAWQARIDATGLAPNMRGSARFWNTAQAHGLDVVDRDGAPDFRRIVFALDNGIGVELSTDEGTPFIHYRFVPIVDEEGT